MGWVSGRVMMGEDVDHEESEAGYFKSNDDTSIDPDIALSYIDEKLENVLGHFQKDFEGGVSAENLGAKFGGYGSFLPTYQRSPSIRSQPKSPQRVHTNITHTPDHVHREGAAKSSSIPDALLHERDGNAAARNTHSLYDDKVQVEKIFDVPSDQVVEKLPLKQRPSPKKSLSLTGQKSLKFRIKVGSDKSAQKNVAIYSGLGLSSPSTSPGNSLGESGRIPVESLVNPDKSPTRILQMLSTLTVVLEPLLSPLPDRLMNLLRDMPSEGKSTQALKDKRDHSAIVGDGYNSKAGGEEIYTGTKSNASRKCELAKGDAILLRVKEKSGAKVLDSRPCGSSDESPKQQLRSIDNDGGSFGNSSTAMNTLKEPEKGNRMKNRKLVINRIKGTLSGAEAVKDNSLRLVSGQGGNKLLHQEARSSSVEKIKDSPVDFPESRRKKVNGITISSKIDSDSFESDRESKGAADHLLQEGGLGSTLGECDKLRMPGCKKKFTSESKSKSKISQVYGKISSESVDDGIKASLSANPRQKKGSKKDTSTSRELYEDLFGHSEVSGCPVGSLEKPSSGDKSKSSNDAVKDERGNSDRLKLKSSQKQVKNQPTSQSLVKDSLKYNVPSTSGLLSEMEHAPKAMEVVQATVPPVLLEDWVECDRCQQWRLLPYGRTEQLPEKWVCSMLDWLPGMNSCDFTEDETTEALRALYRLPLPNNQNSSQYTAVRAVTGVSSVDTLCSNLGNSNVDSHNNIANGSKKMHKAKETSHKGGKPVTNMTIAPRNLEQGPVMRESLNASDSIDQHHSGSGEAKLKKSSKRVSDQHVRSTAKKVKTGRTSDIISSPTSVGSLGRIEFGSTTSVATVAPSDMQESDVCIRLKGAKSEQGIVLRTRKLKEDMMDTNGGSFDARHSSDSRVSLKKIKLKDHKNSQNNVNAMKNGHSLPPDNKVPVVENGVTGFRKNKKPTVSQIEGTLVSGTNGDLQVIQKDVKNRMLSSGVQSCKLDKGVDKEKQLRPFKIKVTSQLTMEDLESLKKDLASEPVPAAAAAAANSSSSKVSDSRKTKLHYSENRGSPVESVCSSPVRLLTIGKLLPLKVECLSHDDVKEGDFRTVGSPIKVENGDIQQSGKARPKRTLGAAHQEFLDNCGNGRLEGNRPCTLEGHDPCLSKEPPFDPYPDKNPSNKRLRTVSLHKKNGKVSPTLPKDRERSLNHKEEPERGSLPRDRQKLSNPKRNAKVVVEVGLGQAAPSVEGLGDVNHQNSTSRSVKITKASKKHVDETRGNQSKRGQHENSDANVNNPCAMDASVRSQDFQSGKRKKNLSVVDFGDEKPQVNQHPQDKHDLLSTKVTVVKEDRKKDLVLSKPREFTGRSEQSKELKDPRSPIHNSESLQGSSPLRGIASCVPGASVVLKEAEGFRDYADRLKNTGFGYECNETNFQAALKFLHGASLLERPNESSKHSDINQMQIYIDSAKLCETCADEYERRQEMAAAALAYKCMEVAYLRVVYCKNVTTNRLCHDLQASLQLVPQGESPSSSASDIDNLNNLALVEKGSTLSKSNTTHFGNHILASSRSRPSFAQLLDFTKDVNSAMEATRKSHDALAAANVILEKAKNTEGILSVKRVIDFSFQDVEELVRLVGFAKEAINRKALHSNRN